jgi:hypothetical protein
LGIVVTVERFAWKLVDLAVWVVAALTAAVLIELAWYLLRNA